MITGFTAAERAYERAYDADSTDNEFDDDVTGCSYLSCEECYG